MAECPEVVNIYENGGAAHPELALSHSEAISEGKASKLFNLSIIYGNKPVGLFFPQEAVNKHESLGRHSHKKKLESIN